MKQLNFRHFNTNSKKFIVTVNFIQKETKTAPKRPILFCLVVRRLSNISKDYRRCPQTSEDFRGEIRKFSTIFLSLFSPCERYLFYSVKQLQCLQCSRVILLPIFEEQIRIYNDKRLWVFHEKPSKHLTVLSTETVNIKNWPI